MITLYSTNCPACRVLESKLKSAHIEFDISNNVDKILDLGFTTAPILETEPNKYLSFKEALNWIQQKEE